MAKKKFGWSKLAATIIGIAILVLTIILGYFLIEINTAMNDIERVDMLPETTEIPTNELTIEPTPEATFEPKAKISLEPSPLENDAVLTTANTSGKYYIPSYSDSDKSMPPRAEGTLNFLLLGVDEHTEQENGRSDTIMIAHIPANREKVYLISIPRDSYVDIPGHGKNKINAAYALGGPQLTVWTIENMLDIKIDHVAMMDFAGFTGMIDTIGGIDINNPYEGCDSSQGFCWKKGNIHLDSNDAIRYVRWRKGLPNGDITRTENQQRVVKAIINKTISKEVLSNPSTIVELMNDVGGFVTLDSTLTNQKIMDIALSVRINSSSDIRSVEFPIRGFDTKRVGSVNLVDMTRLDNLQYGLYTDTMDIYWNND